MSFSFVVFGFAPCGRIVIAVASRHVTIDGFLPLLCDHFVVIRLMIASQIHTCGGKYAPSTPIFGAICRSWADVIAVPSRRSPLLPPSSPSGRLTSSRLVLSAPVSGLSPTRPATRPTRPPRPSTTRSAGSSTRSSSSPTTRGVSRTAATTLPPATLPVTRSLSPRPARSSASSP